jgi:hypothetical protein
MFLPGLAVDAARLVKAYQESAGAESGQTWRSVTVVAGCDRCTTTPKWAEGTAAPSYGAPAESPRK